MNILNANLLLYAKGGLKMTKTLVENSIKDFLANLVTYDGRNRLAAHGDMIIYQRPLVAIAAADDPPF